MTGNRKHTFINYNTSNPRPTPPQRQVVSTYIGKYFRNRSGPAQRKHSTGTEAPFNTSGLTVRTPQPSELNRIPLLRPVVECFVPLYPTEHRQKVFDVLDFHIHYLAARLTHWGTGPTPFMRCWVQMVCGDVTLFDSVATFTHGVRITTMENQITPSATMLWHKTRALRGLQRKISMESEDKEIAWKANETILATFYLMEGAARFGYESEFKSHCLGLLRMMQLRGEVVSACLKDLYVMQAVGLVEGTEMASELRHGADRDDSSVLSRDVAAVATASAVLAKKGLRYLRQDLYPVDPLWAQITVLPAGFQDLVMLGDLSLEFVLLLEELLGSLDREQLQQYGSTTEATEQQNKMMKQAHLLERESNNVVERLACLGFIMFLTRRTSQMQMFPEVAVINKLTTLARQTRDYELFGTSYYGGLRIWATIVSVETTATAGATLKQHAYEAAREFLFQESSTDSWGAVEMRAKRYLWDEKSLHTWKQYWMRHRDMS